MYIFKNGEAIQNLRGQGYGSADFDINESVLQYYAPNQGHLHSSKKVIYRSDTGAELGVHGLDYKAVCPKTMIETTRSIIERSDLDATGIEETIRTSHDGSQPLFSIDYPLIAIRLQMVTLHPSVCLQCQALMALGRL